MRIVSTLLLACAALVAASPNASATCDPTETACAWLNEYGYSYGDPSCQTDGYNWGITQLYVTAAGEHAWLTLVDSCYSNASYNHTEAMQHASVSYYGSQGHAYGQVQGMQSPYGSSCALSAGHFGPGHHGHEHVDLAPETCTTAWVPAGNLVP